jgi:hypothetical protein
MGLDVKNVKGAGLTSISLFYTLLNGGGIDGRDPDSDAPSPSLPRKSRAWACLNELP